MTVYTSESGLRAAATRAGLSPAEYLDRINAGLLFCSRHMDWHPADQFGRDASKATGRRTECRASRRERTSHTRKHPTTREADPMARSNDPAADIERNLRWTRYTNGDIDGWQTTIDWCRIIDLGTGVWVVQLIDDERQVTDSLGNFHSLRAALKTADTHSEPCLICGDTPLWCPEGGAH